MKKHRPKRFIEIYFVLYLAALVLLIPDKKHEDRRANDLISSLLQSSFTIQPERNVLLCRVVRQADQTIIVACDSLNTIYHSGSVKDLSYSFSIEDQSYKSSIQLSSQNTLSASYFQLFGGANEGAMRFAWHPPTQEKRNRLFRVSVRATARPILPLSLSDEQRRYIEELNASEGGLQLHAETQFTIALIYVDGGSNQGVTTALNPQILEQSDSTFRERYRQLLKELEIPRFVSAPLGEFSLQVRDNPLRTIAYMPFENRIRVSGADPRREVEAIQISGGAANWSIDGSDIVVRGTTPPSGIVNYTLSARRSSDKKDTSVNFAILVKNLDAPVVPVKMYPGVNYTFNPNVPELSGSPVGAVLRDDKNMEVISSIQGESFSYKPSIEDTSKVFHFERSVNQKKVGQTLNISILPFPAPEVIEMSVRNGQVWVRTRSYGLQSDSKARVKLELSPQSSAKVQERFGDWVYDEKSNAHVQTFQITNSPSTLSVRAFNAYKKVSERKDFVVRD